MRTDCHDIQQALGLVLAGECSPDETARVDIHLAACDECRVFKARLVKLNGLLAAPVPAPSRDTVQLMALRARESSRRSRTLARFAAVAAVIATILIPVGTYFTVASRPAPRTIASDPFGTADLEF